MDKQIENLVQQLPKESRGDVSLIDIANQLFKVTSLFMGELKTKSRKIRIVYSPKDEQKKSSVMIILDEKLCLWFFNNEDGWIYDGWEMGNYEGSWEDKTLN